MNHNKKLIDNEDLHLLEVEQAANNQDAKIKDSDQRLDVIVCMLQKLLERMSSAEPSDDDTAFPFATLSPEEAGLIRATRAALPDPRLVRQIIRQRELRNRFFDSELFADPAWDMLLDLTAARAEHHRVSVTSLCIAAAVPATTALRWINVLIEAGLAERIDDDTDKRRAFVVLSDRGADTMARYFREVVKQLASKK